jgi:hypothetical protein
MRVSQEAQSPEAVTLRRNKLLLVINNTSKTINQIGDEQLKLLGK